MRKILLATAFAALFATGHISAQNELYLQSGASLYVVSNDGVNPTLYVNGTTTLAGSSSALANNSGWTRYTGNVTNTGGTYTSTGQDQFSGSSSQTLAGTFSGTSYLGDVKRQQSSGASIVLATNVDANTLSLGSNPGTVDAGTNGKTLYIKSNVYSAISGYSSSTYIDVGNSSAGFLKRGMNDVTSGDAYTFPIGNSVAGYKRIDVNLSSLGSTGASTSTATLKNSSPGSVSFSKRYATGFSGPSGGPCAAGTHPQWVQLSCMTSNYWSFSGPTDWQYVVSVFNPGCSGPRIRRVLQSPVGTGTWTAGIETTIVGSITSNLCANSDWSNGSASSIPGGTYRGLSADLAIATGTATALPVELVSFSATAVDNTYVRCAWTTATEIDNAGFHLLRSEDAETWREIAYVKSLAAGRGGNSEQTLNYAFPDRDVVAKTYYYQLIQENFDGQSVPANIESATLTGTAGSSVSVFPNPSSGTVNIRISPTVQTTANISMFDLIGQQVINQTVQVPASGTTTAISLSQLTEGIYLVEVTTTDGTFTTRLTVQNSK